MKASCHPVLSLFLRAGGRGRLRVSLTNSLSDVSLTNQSDVTYEAVRCHLRSSQMSPTKQSDVPYKEVVKCTK